jgi:hypothetical protein
MNLDDLPTQLSQSPAAAGTVGALLSLRWVPGNSWGTKAFSFSGSMAVVIFAVPWALDVMSVTSKSAPPAFGLIAGLLGMNLLTKAVDYVAQTQLGDLIASFWRKPS